MGERTSGAEEKEVEEVLLLMATLTRWGFPRSQRSGLEKRVITKGVLSLDASLESLKSLNSLENGRMFLNFPQSGWGSLESLNSLESLEKILF